MHSGLLRFHMNDPEEVFSGISAVLSVAPPPPEPAGLIGPLLDSMQTRPQEDQLDEVNLMQQSTNAMTSAHPQVAAVNSHAKPFDHRMTRRNFLISEPPFRGS